MKSRWILFAALAFVPVLAFAYFMSAEAGLGVLVTGLGIGAALFLGFLVVMRVASKSAKR